MHDHKVWPNSEHTSAWKWFMDHLTWSSCKILFYKWLWITGNDILLTMVIWQNYIYFYIDKTIWILQLHKWLYSDPQNSPVTIKNIYSTTKIIYVWENWDPKQRNNLHSQPRRVRIYTYSNIFTTKNLIPFEEHHTIGLNAKEEDINLNILSIKIHIDKLFSNFQCVYTNTELFLLTQEFIFHCYSYQSKEIRNGL